MSDNHQNGQERPDAEKPSSPGAAAGGTGGGNGNGTREPPNGGRARYGRGAQQIQTAIEKAAEFLKQTYPVGKDANNQDDLSVYRIIPDCLGGTLCLMEYRVDLAALGRSLDLGEPGLTGPPRQGAGHDRFVAVDQRDRCLQFLVGHKGGVDVEQRLSLARGCQDAQRLQVPPYRVAPRQEVVLDPVLQVPAFWAGQHMVVHHLAAQHLHCDEFYQDLLSRAGVADLALQVVLDGVCILARVRAAVEVRERQPPAERPDAALLALGHRGAALARGEVLSHNRALMGGQLPAGFWRLEGFGFRPLDLAARAQPELIL